MSSQRPPIGFVDVIIGTSDIQSQFLPAPSLSRIKRFFKRRPLPVGGPAGAGKDLVAPELRRFPPDLGLAAPSRTAGGDSGRRAEMTSTNMFQGLDSSGKPSSRVLRPPGGGSSDLFGVSENTSQATKPHKMASNIFGPPEEAQSGPKRTNPPGGKSSGIFGESETARHQQRHVPPGGKSSNIFGDPVSSTAVRGHPNKPKDTNIFEDGNSNQEPESPQPKAEVPEERPKEQEKENGKEEKEEAAPPQPPSEEAAFQPSVDDHEPRLGPRPRSHNKVIHPPGGKSSVAFY